MSEEKSGDVGDALSGAKDTIQRQEAEIKSLRAQLADEHLCRNLKRALLQARATGAIASPVSHSRLLTLIVEASTYVTSAQAGSLFLIDEEAQELFFEVGVGPKVEAIKELRLPIGQGIAGLVAVSGNPLIIANVDQDSRHAADIARAAGYFPKSILCVPLTYADRVIGVLEVLDKQGADSFLPADMEVLGLFAKQAAVAIELSSTSRNLSALLTSSLKDVGGSQDEERGALLESTHDFVDRFEETVSYKRALDLAGLVREIAWSGGSELMLCEAILRNVADYVRSLQDSSLSELLI